MKEKMKKNGNKRNQRGASLVEYALLVALISVVAITGITALGTKANSKLDSVATQISN